MIDIDSSNLYEFSYYTIVFYYSKLFNFFERIYKDYNFQFILCCKELS